MTGLGSLIVLKKIRRNPSMFAISPAWADKPLWVRDIWPAANAVYTNRKRAPAFEAGVPIRLSGERNRSQCS